MTTGNSNNQSATTPNKNASGGDHAPETAAVKSLEQEQARQHAKPQRDELTKALEESFPASDPVAETNPTTSTVHDKNASEK